MFDYIKGTLVGAGKNRAVVENNGIGYEFGVSANCLRRLGAQGADVTIYAYLSVREDGVGLYGFFSRAEKDMFLRLLGVGGIGPKAAVAILGGLTPDELTLCIAGGDVKALSSVKGIGKKTAERLILELKDKLSEEFLLALPVNTTPKLEDAVNALISLGFSKNEAAAAIKRVDCEGLTLEQIIMQSLKKA